MKMALVLWRRDNHILPIPANMTMAPILDDIYRRSRRNETDLTTVKQ